MQINRTRRRTASVLTTMGGAAALAVALLAGPSVGLADASSSTGAPNTTAPSTTAPGTTAPGTTSPSTTSPSTTAPGTTTPSAAAAACDRGPWELKVEGRPVNLDGGDRGGVYLWHSTTGFHLRVTHRTDERVVYSGLIRSSAPMRMEPVKLERGDHVRMSPDRRVIAFAFANHGHIDGINFHTDCARSLTVSWLHADRHRLSTDRVYLGATKAHPARIPFVVHRLV